MREPPGPRGQKTKAFEEVQEGGGKREGQHCVGELPLYLFRSAGGVRVTLHLGLQLPCGVCDSPCNGNGGASHRGHPFVGQQRELKLPFPQGGGRLWALLRVPSKPKL